MNRLKVFLRYPNKKSLFKIVKEVIILAFRKKEIPFYYFKYLFRKDVVNYLDYLGLREQSKLQHHYSLHNPDYVSIITNKLYFSLLVKTTTINVSKLICYNLKSVFFYNNKVIRINNKEELLLLMKNIFEEECIESLFFRPPLNYGGKGCFKLSKASLSYDKLQEVYETLITGDFLHNKVISQHNLINKIHSKSINTLRIITLITSDNKTEIVSAVMRFGVGNSVVDNASSGGFFVGINLDTGILKKFGHFLPEYGGGKITEHPDSNFVLEGFKIPFYKEACKCAIDAVNVIPDRLIGWDIAITPSGPIVIEANATPHINLSDIAYGGLLKNKHIKKVLEELS